MALDRAPAATLVESETPEADAAPGAPVPRARRSRVPEGNVLKRLLRVPLPALLITDSEGQLLDANDAFLRLTGVSREQVDAGQVRWDALAAPETPSAGAQAVDALRRLGSAGPLETEYVRADGTRVPVVLAALGLEAPERILVLVQDLTPRRRAEEALRFLSDASRELAEVRAEPDAILAGVAHLAASSVATWCLVDMLEEDGAFRRVAAAHQNPEREQHLREAPNFPATHEVGSALFQALARGESRLYPDFLPEHLEQMVRTAEQRKLLERLGARSVMLVPMRSRGQAVGLFTFASCDPGRRYGPEDLEMVEELSRRVVAAVDNARLYHEAQEAVHLRDEFLGIASHELKTPLTPLRLKLQALQRQAGEAMAEGAQLSPEKVSDSLDVALRQVRKLTDLVDNLLDVARISAGRLRLDMEEVDLSSVAAELLSRFAPSAEKMGCELELHAPEPVFGRWDRLRVEQVVTNLLSNALKYGAGRPVVVRVEEDGERARLTVQDHGIGIAEEDLERIFERFERAVSDRHYGGLGLGLYITRQIVEAFGGTVRVVSNPGEGSTFTLELPRGQLPIIPSFG
ncbi:sensor histidine kinase [Hyalangium minutum]|uniref:histidine kinase n=1 Tax=Hyalangium minutum TaxID=394096 RepID=A0A085WKY6_9BACT|nr:PAS domain-containing sensor histidine kinase [Hyalangium minutum]KFE68349.1 Phosphate regulon sensor protein PhoR (SphS) [Hyalangium minutum]